MNILPLLALLAAPASLLSRTSFAMVGETTLAVRDQPSCPYCGLDVPSDTKSTDYRVTLKSNGKSDLYRCVFCAVAAAPSGSDDLLIIAPSNKKGHPVQIRREKGEWSVEPKSAVFAVATGEHAHCHVIYRALLHREDLDEYIATDPKLLKDAKAFVLHDLIAKTKKADRG